MCYLSLWGNLVLVRIKKNTHVYTQITLSCIKSQLSNLSCLHPPLPHLNHPPLSALPHSEHSVGFQLNVLYKTACRRKTIYQWQWYQQKLGGKKVCLYLALVTVKLFPECVVDVHAICMTAVDKQNYCREVIRGRSDREHFFAVSRLFPVVFFGQSAFYVLLMHPGRLRV